MSGEKALVPELRFPEFDGAWEHVRLSQLGKFKSGSGFPDKEQGGLEGIPFYKVSDMNRSGNDLTMKSANNYVSVDQIARLKLKPIKKKSIIFAKVGAAIFLERKRIARDFLIDNNMMSFTPNSDLDFEFIWTIFQRTRLSKYAQVGALPSYNASDVGALSLCIPNDAEEQQKIAAFLDAVSKKITLLTQKREALTNYKRGLMQRLFSGTLRFTRPDGTAFPDWEERKLGDVGTLYSGLTGKSSGDFGFGQKYVTYRQVFGSSKLDVSGCQRVQIHEGEKQSVVKCGDVLATTSSETPNEVGFASVVLDEVGELYLNSFCFGFRPNNLNELLPEFSRYLFRSPSYRSAVFTLAQGSTRFNISRSGFLKITLRFPRPEEQTKIADALSALDAKIDAVSMQISQMEAFKKGLLQKMFV